MDILDGWPVLVPRLFLGTVFLIAGVLKIADSTDLSDTARKIVGFDSPGLALAVKSLPWIEVFLGAGLLTGLLTLVFGVLALLLLVGLTSAAVVARLRGVKAPCNCFGRIKRDEIGPSLLVRNALLVCLATSIVVLTRDPIASSTATALETGVSSYPWLLAMTSIATLLGGVLIVQVLRTFEPRRL